jgi:uncharacterized iron-regulated protein
MLYRVFFIIVLLFLPPAAYAVQHGHDLIPSYELDVSFDVVNARLSGISRVYVKVGQEVVFRKGPLTVTDLRFNDKVIDFHDNSGVVKIVPDQAGVIQIKYTGVFRDDSQRHELHGGVVKNIIGEKGISLTGVWYPVVDGLSYYKLKVTLPKGYEAVSEAEEIQKVKRKGNVEFYFTFSHPLDGINFIATNKYKVLKDRFRNVEIYAYFFREDVKLAKTYIAFTKQYLELYEDLLPQFPYKRFSIVENFLPTGYSMPTFTLLGKTVIKLPFIVETSLGHEILHQWFGNNIYVDYESGNWAEGLTTYLADHLYQERKGQGWEYRKQMLIDYKSYVTEENDFPLKTFIARKDSPSKAVGYGKTALVFHMLRNMVGDRSFFDALRHLIRDNRFQFVSWKDIQISFEKFSKENLNWFFEQWIQKKGIPEFFLDEAHVRFAGGSFELTFNILQKGEIYSLDVPVTLFTDAGKIKKTFRIKNKESDFTMFLTDKPLKIVMDEDYDIPRVISRDEFPPVIARILRDEPMVVVVPPENRTFYESITEYFQKKGATIKEPVDMKESDIKSFPLVICGVKNELVARLYGKISEEDAGFSVYIRENPWNPEMVIGVFNASSKDEVEAAFRKIFHYGKYSTLVFDKGRNIDKQIAQTKRGMVVELNQGVSAVDISTITELSDIVKSITDKKIIYVGEMHDVFAHHAVQLDIIRGLFQEKGKIAIGMEMFQKPFQKILDSFTAGTMDERDFLKQSEYFKRWGFDYNLYKPLLDFARANSIPVLALNIHREIIDKVSEKGMDSLSDEEKKIIPSEMNFSDDTYRERLEEVFHMHKDWQNRNFDYFYESQILWDETMAQSIQDFLEQNSDYQMVVLAGKGHLEYGSGIPKRTYRRNGYAYSIVLIDAEVEQGIADYVVFPKPVEGITAPKLMVFLKVHNGDIEIAGFPEQSVSEEAGLIAGDIIRSLDKEEVNTIEDIKIHLLYKERGDRINMKVLRKKQEVTEELEFDVRL